MMLNNKQTRPVVATGLTGQIILQPGINEVPEAEYAFIRPSLEGAGLFKSKLLEEGPTKEAKEGTKVITVGKSLSECSKEQAEALILETFVVKLLETWKKNEKRDDVRLAIVNQIDEVKKGPKTSDDGDEA